MTTPQAWDRMIPGDPIYQPAVRYCAGCGAELVGRSLVVEYWRAYDTVFVCWCSRCGWHGEVYASSRVTSSEPAI